MNDLFTHVLVINLDKDTERWEKCQKELEKAELQAIRIPGIYGPDMSDTEYKKNTTCTCYYFCTRKEVGCWLSHRKCWQYIVDNNIESALILEDDCIFDQDFQKKLKQYSKDIPENWDMILLGMLLECTKQTCGPLSKFANQARKILTGQRDENKYISENVYKPNSFQGAHGYIVSRKCAEKLLSLLYLADGGVDIAIARQLQYIKCYAVTPSIIRQDASIASSTQSVNYPRSLNFQLDKIREGYTGVGFMLSSPLIQIEGYLVNSWTAIFFLLGLLLYADSRKILTTLIAILLLTELFLKFDKSTVIQVTGSIVVMFIGYSISRLIFLRAKN